MGEPVRFYFDFASPYAYFASTLIDGIGAEFDRPVEWRPVLVWAILKAHGIAPPMEAPVKRAYFLKDMERSARFLGVDYREPVRLPLSSHLAARLYYVLHEDDPGLAGAFARGVFHAFFVAGEDISDDSTLVSIAKAHGVKEQFAREAMTSQTGRDLLQKAVTEAVADGVIGSPHFIADGEGFFGADRLPQLRWHLEGRG